MSRNIFRWILASLIVSSLINSLSTQTSAGSSPAGPVVRYRDTDAGVEAKIDAALPAGLALVDRAIATLSLGADGLGAEEWALLERYFDPGHTGQMDAAFVASVLENYRAIRAEFFSGVIVEYETENSMCVSKRLYYTEFIKVHICPYFRMEEDADRITRDFVHELAHLALFAKDREYYAPGSAEYAALSPHGHWTSGIPLVGRVFRELTLQDTLYNPDAYSEFAYALRVLAAQAEAGGVSELAAGAEIPVSEEALSAASMADRKFFSH